MAGHPGETSIGDTLTWDVNVFSKADTKPNTISCDKLPGTWNLKDPYCCSVAAVFNSFGDPMDCSLPGSSVHGISQSRILEWLAIFFFWGSSWPRDHTHVSCTAGRFFTTKPTGNTLTSMITAATCCTVLGGFKSFTNVTTALKLHFQYKKGVLEYYSSCYKSLWFWMLFSFQNWILKQQLVNLTKDFNSDLIILFNNKLQSLSF